MPPKHSRPLQGMSAIVTSSRFFDKNNFLATILERGMHFHYLGKLFFKNGSEAALHLSQLFRKSLLTIRMGIERVNFLLPLYRAAIRNGALY